MKNTQILVAALALVAAVGLTGCKNDKAETTTATTPSTEAMKSEARTGPMNKMCPFSGEEAKADITSTCDGKTVAFCCAGCKGKFDKMDKAHQEAMMAKAK